MAETAVDVATTAAKMMTLDIVHEATVRMRAVRGTTAASPPTALAATTTLELAHGTHRGRQGQTYHVITGRQGTGPPVYVVHLHGAGGGAGLASFEREVWPWSWVLPVSERTGGRRKKKNTWQASPAPWMVAFIQDVVGSVGPQARVVLSGFSMGAFHATTFWPQVQAPQRASWIATGFPYSSSL